MAQTATVSVSIKQVMHRAEFGRGYYQALAGEPFQKDDMGKRQFTYERGRHFAAYMKSLGITDLRLKQNKAIRAVAIQYFREAKNCGAII